MTCTQENILNFYFFQNIHVCTVYTNLGDDAVAHALNETAVSVVVTSHDLLPRFKEMLSFRFMICWRVNLRISIFLKTLLISLMPVTKRVARESEII